jgi:CRP/FNR family transcriptional regulator, cyclic AMP receptor protein
MKMFNQADLTSTLTSIPWFHEMDSQRLELIANISNLREVSPDEEVFQEGERDDFLYVVIDGQISIEMLIPGHGQTQIYVAEPLDIFGWSSLTPVVRQRTATARALCRSHLIAIEANALRLLCEEDYYLGYSIMRRLSNVVASRLLTTRLTLMGLLANTNPDFPNDPPCQE